MSVEKMLRDHDAKWTIETCLSQLDCQGTFHERKIVRVLRRLIAREMVDPANLEPAEVVYRQILEGDREAGIQTVAGLLTVMANQHAELLELRQIAETKS